MFSNTLTNRASFGNTYRWAVLSTLPMEDGSGDGMRPTDVNSALGMPKEARTTVSLLLKEMAAAGLVKRYQHGPRWVEYTRLLPLRKRERIARWINR